jgi:peptide deformylase
MSVRKIARLGQPVLLARAQPVDPADLARAELQQLVDDMIETMTDAEGIGLAAPQVFESLRLVVAMELGDRSERGRARTHILVNPELTPLGEDRSSAFEGCLSIPDLRGAVPRWRRVAWRALDRHGEPIQGEAEGLFARVLQHEVDHLDGILYPMRMTDLRLLAFGDELPHLSDWLERAGDER